MVTCIKKFFHFVGLHRRREKYGKPLLCHEKPSYPRSCPKELPWSLLLELPLDILVCIVPYLPLVSRVCLALTCKPLYRLLRPALDDEQLSWPRYLASPLTFCKEFGSQLYLPRVELLLKLEDARWLYCCGCLKLHPYSYFSQEYTDTPASCVPSLDRNCNATRGIVDLCSCLALTYTNGERLSEWIQTGVPSPGIDRNIEQQFRYQVLNNKNCLIHKCSVTTQPDVFLNLAIILTLDAGKYLVVTTRYNVYWSAPHKHLGDMVNKDEAYRPPLNTEPVFLCPEVHVLAWLYGITALTQGYKNACRLCDTTFHLLLCTDDGLHSVIQSERNLGLVQNDPNRPGRLMLGSWSWWHSSRRPGNCIERLWYRWD